MVPAPPPVQAQASLQGISMRLVWLRRHHNNKKSPNKKAASKKKHTKSSYWPALLYKDYGEVLHYRSPVLSLTLKHEFAMHYLKQQSMMQQSKDPVAEWIEPVSKNYTRDSFVNLGTSSSDATEALDFFQHMSPILSSVEAQQDKGLQGAMKRVTELLQKDFGNPAPAVAPEYVQQVLNRSTSSSSSSVRLQEDLNHAEVEEQEVDDEEEIYVEEEMEEEEESVEEEDEEVILYEGDPFDAADDFDMVWEKLQEEGWKWRQTKNGDEWYLSPHVASLKDGNKGIDTFTKAQLIEYVQAHYGWEPTDAKKSAKKRARANTNKGPGAKKVKKTHTKKNPSTPPHRTQPQDPAAPRSAESETSSEEEDDEEDKYVWRFLLADLKKRGWTVKRSSNPLHVHGYYYVRPGKNTQEGILGTDYFDEPSGVIDFERAQDERVLGKSNNSKKKKAQSTSIQNPKHPTARSQAKPAAKQTVAPPKRREPTEWWQKEAVPYFGRGIWPLLRDQLDFRYAGGIYRLPSQSTDATLEFPSDHQLRHHLCAHGIPHVERLNEEEKTALLRWTTFCHVPVKDTTSVQKLREVDVLSHNQAIKLLCQHVGFTNVNGVYRRGTETFKSVEEVRVWVRSAPALVPPGEGGRRSRQTKSTLSDNEILVLRLWGALASTPLPTALLQEPSPVVACTPPPRRQSPRRQSSATQHNTRVDVHEDNVNEDQSEWFTGTQETDARRVTMDSSQILLTQKE